MKYVYLLLRDILAIGAVVAWIAGIVIAKGFWSTLFAWFPFWAWYLVVERIMLRAGLL